MILALLTKLGIPQWAAEMLIGAAAIALLGGGSAYLGYHYKATADQVALQAAELQHQAQLLVAQKKAAEIQANFDHDEDYIKQLQDKLQQEVTHVTTVYRTVPGARLQALPHCVFTNGFVRVWNDAQNPDLPGPAAGAAPAPGTGAAAAPDDYLDSGIGQADVLDNHVDNAASCAAVTDQLNKLIDFYQQTKQPGS